MTRSTFGSFICISIKGNRSCGIFVFRGVRLFDTLTFETRNGKLIIYTLPLDQLSVYYIATTLIEAFNIRNDRDIGIVENPKKMSNNSTTLQRYFGGG